MRTWHSIMPFALGATFSFLLPTKGLVRGITSTRKNLGRVRLVVEGRSMCGRRGATIRHRRCERRGWAAETPTLGHEPDARLQLLDTLMDVRSTGGALGGPNSGTIVTKMRIMLMKMRIMLAKMRIMSST